jgi:hypothetical protein
MLDRMLTEHTQRDDARTTKPHPSRR